MTRLIFLLLLPVVFALGETDRTLPAGTRLQLRLLDYLNAEHEPLGQTFRAIVEVEAAKGLVPAKSRALVRLVGGPDSQTLECIAVRLGPNWMEFRAKPQEGSILVKADDLRPKDRQQPPLAFRGRLLYIPSGSILTFELKGEIRMQDVGPERI